MDDYLEREDTYYDRFSDYFQSDEYSYDDYILDDRDSDYDY